jgi:hypothetical protein
MCGHGRAECHCDVASAISRAGVDDDDFVDDVDKRRETIREVVLLVAGDQCGGEQDRA